MLSQALRALETSKAKYVVGALASDDVIQWSRRVLEVQRAAAQTEADELDACIEHYTRMRKLRYQVKLVYERSSVGVDVEAYAAACYYAAEAELWWLDAGGEVPEDEALEDDPSDVDD